MTIFTDELKADILAGIFNSVSETEAPPFWAGKFWGAELKSRFGLARSLEKTPRYGFLLELDKPVSRKLFDAAVASHPGYAKELFAFSHAMSQAGVLFAEDDDSLIEVGRRGFTGLALHAALLGIVAEPTEKEINDIVLVARRLRHASSIKLPGVWFKVSCVRHMPDGRLVSAQWHNRYSVVYGEDQASYSFRDSNPARRPSIFQPSAAFDVYLYEEFAPFINEAFFSHWSGFDLSHVCMIAADMALQGHEQMIVRCLDTNHVVPLGNICSYETARVAVSEVLGSRCRAKVIRPEVECEAVYRFIVVDGAIVGSPTGYDNSSVRTLVQNVVALHPVYNPDAVIDVGIIDGKPSLQAISPVMAAAWNVDDTAVWQALKTAQMRRARCFRRNVR